MASPKSIFARRNVVDTENMEVDQEFNDNSRTMDLMIGFLGLVFFGLVLATCLIYLRRTRQRRRQSGNGGGILPTYADSTNPNSNSSGAFTIHTTDKHGRSSVLVIGADGQPMAAAPMLSHPQQPPHARDNVPQIRITFPDEQDEATGRTTAKGRVVVVRVGEGTAAVGLEPLREEEQLPAYEKEGVAGANAAATPGGFVSIDMDQIGGLKEKRRDEFR